MEKRILIKSTHWKLNTSNQGKFEEFKRLFSQYGALLETSHYDLKEIEADPISVIAHKASQQKDNTLVEDTSLEIEGASIGINIRWLLNHLHQYVGHRADWTVLLAYRQGNQVLLYKGSVTGTIVEPKGSSGFGFDPVFLPTGAIKTLAEEKPDSFNARAKAVEALMKGNVWAQHPVMEKWEGKWQQAAHQPEQKKALRFIRIWTILYAVTFPFIFWISLFSFMISDNPKMTGFVGHAIVFACLSVPVSMLISIKKMRSNYKQKEYKKARRYFALPFLILAIAILFITFITPFA